MKKSVLILLMMACLPFLAMAQSNDDLYFIPKKKTEKGTPAKVVIEKENAPTTVYASPGTTIVVKDAEGDLRDVDEYNRRYTSRDNSFTLQNDTLYVEEKPYDEQGEWVNGFDGSSSDYEYAMRIVRFRNPRYAIPVSSPLYWEVVYALPSWEWNVYHDGFYAYAFPTYTNRLWWDWRFDYSWGWRSPLYYSSWYSWGYPYHHHRYHVHYPHHHHPHYAWGGVGGHWGSGYGWNGSSARNPGIHAGRYTSANKAGYASSQTSSRRTVNAGNRNRRDAYVGNGTVKEDSRNRTSVRKSSGRVVTSQDNASSVRPQRSSVNGRRTVTADKKEATNVRSNSSYTRPAKGKGSSYNRESSTRSTVNNRGAGSSYQRKGEAAEKNAYQKKSSERRSESRSSYESNRSSSSRGNYSSGSSHSRSSSQGSSSRSGGGGSRSGGRR